MAYVSKEEVEKIKIQVKAGLKKLGYKGTVSVKDYQKVILKVKTNGALINPYKDFDLLHVFANQNCDEYQIYMKQKAERERIYNEIKELEKLLILDTYYYNSNAMIDYFDEAYYYEVRIID